jgi:hypothetical protein
VQDPSRRSFEGIPDALRFSIEALYYHGGLTMIGALLFVPLFGLLRAVGAPYLYWHDGPLTQACVGTVVGLVFWHLGIVAYSLAVAEPGAVPVNEGDRAEAKRLMHLVLVPVLLLLFIGAVATCRMLDIFPSGLPPHYGLPFLGGLFLSYVLTRQLLVLLERGTERGAIAWALARLDGFTLALWVAALNSARTVDRMLVNLGFDEQNHPSAHLERLRSVNEQRRRVFGLMVFFSLSMMFIYLLLSGATHLDGFAFMPAAIPYCLTLGVVAGIYGVLRVVVWRLNLPVFFALLLFGVWQAQQFPNGTGIPSNCEIAEDQEACEAEWSSSRSFRTPTTPYRDQLVPDDQALAAQLAARPGPIVVITTSGGGIRSAAWTVAVFDQLQQFDPDFFAHVRLVTGASGGMVGAAHWISAYGVAHLEARQGPDPGELFCAASTSSLYAPLANAMFFTPFVDRGEALERAWELESPTLARPIHTLAPLEARGVLPSLMFAPMIIEDGSQMLMGNLDLHWYALGDHSRQTMEPPGCDAGTRNAEGACFNARQFFAHVPGQTVKISTVARVGASFPFVTPAVTLPFDEAPRAVDAGYYDNYGTKLAVAWITQHTVACSGDTTCLGDRPILLLELRDHDPDKWTEPDKSRAVFQEFSSPIEGLFKAQRHVANHRNAAAVDRIMRELGGQLEHVVLHFDKVASLSWELTQAERRAIWASAESEASWPRLREWWLAQKGAWEKRPEATVAMPACLEP